MPSPPMSARSLNGLTNLPSFRQLRPCVLSNYLLSSVKRAFPAPTRARARKREDVVAHRDAGAMAMVDASN